MHKPEPNQVESQVSLRAHSDALMHDLLSVLTDNPVSVHVEELHSYELLATGSHASPALRSMVPLPHEGVQVSPTHIINDPQLPDLF